MSIKGVEKLNGTTHAILPDMIEIGSWIGLAAMTRSKLRIKNVSWENLGQIPDVLENLVLQFKEMAMICLYLSIRTDIQLPII